MKLSLIAASLLATATNTAVINSEDPGKNPPPVRVQTSNGVVVLNNQTVQTAGRRGPVVLQDFEFIDKLSHFDRERIPERVVHAKGAGAHGVLKIDNDKLARYTKAKFLTTPGTEIPMFARFSTVGGERGSADTARDPRGFALKFYTDEGNWDLVGNNTPVFFLRDPSKFPDFIHTQKRNPQTNLKDANMFWDFISLVPETLHQVTILFSDKGTPDGFRHMDGFGSHTFNLVNDEGEVTFVKFHFVTDQGVKNLLPEDAAALASSDPDYATRDLFESIEKGDFPSWTFAVQVMTASEALNYRYDIFDVTKEWPLEGEFAVPLIEIGKMTLNRNPANFFAETEQSAFAPAHMPAGIEASFDKMLQGRLFTYPDTQRHRLGTNHQQIPINRPLVEVFNQQRDGFMTVNGNGGSLPNYEPNSVQEGGPVQAAEVITFQPELEGLIDRHDQLIDDDIDFEQPGNLFRSMNEEEQTRLVQNIAGSLSGAREDIQKRQLAIFAKADEQWAYRVRHELHRIANGGEEMPAEEEEASVPEAPEEEMPAEEAPEEEMPAEEAPAEEEEMPEDEESEEAMEEEEEEPTADQ